MEQYYLAMCENFCPFLQSDLTCLKISLWHSLVYMEQNRRISWVGGPTGGEWGVLCTL